MARRAASAAAVTRFRPQPVRVVVGLVVQAGGQGDAGQRGRHETRLRAGDGRAPFVVDGKGVIRRQYIGPLNASNITGVLRELEQVR